MDDRQVAVVGVGMVTAVGLSAPETAASVRAGIARFCESEIVDQELEPRITATVPTEGLPRLRPSVRPEPGHDREQRLLRLAVRPLSECLAGYPPTLPPPPVLVALPRTDPPLDPRSFLCRLTRQLGGTIDAERSDALLAGRSGGLAVVGRAAEWIRAGHGDWVLAGGVDSYEDAYLLAELEELGRVKTAANLDGFVPGEGAAWVLLASGSIVREHGLEPIADVAAFAEGWEPGHLHSPEPYRGEGLAAAVSALVERTGGPEFSHVYSSMNGESHWAKEWGVTVIRNRAAFAEELRMHHPADCYGDPGAAAGPLLVGLAALGIRAGTAPGPALVYASCDDGPRAALALRSV